MTIDELRTAVRRFCDEHFSEHERPAEYAAVVIHIQDGVPDATIPVPISPPPPPADA